jgi:preprotein translocase subunit YajC
MHSILHAFLAQTAPGGQGLGQMLIPLAAIAVVFYFLMIRPQQKQQKKHQAFVGGLKKGDDVVTQSGILGKVASVEDRTVTLDVGAGTKIRILKAQVAGQWIEKPAAEAEAKK